MLQHISYFEGHGGAVTSLVSGKEEESFYSAGAEGLIVRWQLSKPNEGDVLVKLKGFISAIRYEPITNTLLAAVNHKGLFVIDIDTRKIINTIEIPATSFRNLELSAEYGVINTQFGELIIIDIKSHKIIQRLESGLNGFSEFSLDNGMLWYASSQGVKQIDITTQKELNLNFVEATNSLNVFSDKLVISSLKGLYLWNTQNSRSELQFLYKENIEPIKTCYDFNNSVILTLSKTNSITTYKVEKRKIKKLDVTQIEHNGGINDILWIENYKFVITAGSDKKIGVWQVN